MEFKRTSVIAFFILGAGLFSYWRGNSVNLFSDKYRPFFLEAAGKDTSVRCLMANIVTAGAASICSQLPVYPLDFTRTRMAVDEGRRYGGIISCLMQLGRANGALSLYRGVTPIDLNRTLYFGIFQTARTNAAECSRTECAFMKNWAVAQVTVISLTLYLFDTVSRRMMMQGGQPPSAVKYKNDWD